MKSKGAIQAFSIALALACLFYMSFSVVTYMVNKDAEEYSELKGKDKTEEEKKEIKKNYLDSMESVEVYNIGIASYTFNECKKNKLNLGLDLQGGMHVTLEISLDKLIKKLSGSEENENVKKALEMANQRQLTSQDPYVDLFYESYLEIADGESLFRAFDTPENRDKFDRSSENRDEEVLNFIRSEAEQAVERTQDIIRTRIDEFGVTQPTIRQEGSGRITIELPGVEDAQRVRDLLQRSAKLEFWETYNANEMVGKYFSSVNEVLAKKLDFGKEEEATTEAATEGTATETENDVVSNLEASAKNDSLKEDSTKTNVVAALEGESDEITADMDSATKDSIEKAKAQKEAAEKVPLYLKLRPQVDNQGQIVDGPVIGTAIATDTNTIMNYFRMPEVKAVLPSNVKFLWSVKEIQEGSRVYSLYALKTVHGGAAPLDGSVITDAFQNYDQISGKPDVNMKMNPQGARIWKAMTEANIEKWIAISLDNRIYSAPQVNTVIPNGSSVIQGNFTIEEAKDLASVLKAGKLPVTVDIAEEELVGPTLGQESIKNGLNSLIGGFLLVLAFMAFYYRKSGWVANLALMANLFFIVGILASLHAALTLPGMAGIVLTIGMSVDANVLIFERIREELKAGKSVKMAVADGYRNAYSSIIDANLTTFLTGIILLVFGKGPISGFAVILVIGILTSMFCAIFLTRLVFEWMLKREQNINFGSETTSNAFQKMNFDFIGKRKIAYIGSGIVIVIGLISLFTLKLNLSVDFEGGRSYIIQFDQPISVTETRNELTTVFGTSPEVKTFGSDSKLKIITKYRIEDKGEDVDNEVKKTLTDALTAKFADNGFKIEKSQKVGPTFARDIEIAALWSIVVGLIGIFLYIVVRFRKWQYGLGALIALIHDVLIVIGLFSLLWKFLPINLEVDQAFIAAILTVVGYSINDTVVVFDRIRESLNLHTKSPLYQTINDALNKTISRTLITSLTTLLVILILFLFGGEIIRGFSFALLIGVLVGTYSSLFIATPIVVDLDNSKRARE
ncbi:protein translocase subunit SecDF [bacterium]|nr:protein translocase subunit SecDF [bacterium]